MKNKNLMFAMLFISIILVSSFVFAGITGYILKERGDLQAVSEGYQASLRSVDGDIAIIVVQAPDGSLETVEVAEDGSVTTSFGAEVTIGKIETPFLGRPRVEVNVISTSEKTFRNSYWKCYDGLESYEGGPTSCKTSELWQQYAQDFCDGYCNKDGTKCGVDSFSVSNPCATEEEQPPTEGQCPGIATGSCRWVFEQNEIGTATPKGAIKSVTANCISGEIVFEGSCYSQGISQQGIELYEEYTEAGADFTCGFRKTKDPPFDTTIYAGALCCSQ